MMLSPSCRTGCCLPTRMTQAFALSDRTQTQAAVCYFDLNGFKPINDRYGHDMGDEVLKITGRRLLEQVRGNDTAARIGRRVCAGAHRRERPGRGRRRHCAA